MEHLFVSFKISLPRRLAVGFVLGGANEHAQVYSRPFAKQVSGCRLKTVKSSQDFSLSDGYIGTLFNNLKLFRSLDRSFQILKRFVKT